MSTPKRFPVSVISVLTRAYAPAWDRDPETTETTGRDGNPEERR